jgi:hypothetical protein
VINSHLLYLLRQPGRVTCARSSIRGLTDFFLQNVPGSRSTKRASYRVPSRARLGVCEEEWGSLAPPSKDHGDWDFEAVEAHLIRAHAMADFPGNENPLSVAPYPKPNGITSIQARERLDFVHVFRHPTDEAEVLAGDKIVPKPALSS